MNEAQLRRQAIIFTEEVGGALVGDGTPRQHQYTFHDVVTGRCLSNPHGFPDDQSAIDWWKNHRPVDYRQRYPQGVEMRCWDLYASPARYAAPD